MDLTSTIEQNKIRGIDGALKLKLFDDASFLPLNCVEIWDLEDKFNSILFVQLSDVINLILLSHFFKECFVISGPLSDWQLCDFKDILLGNIVNTCDNMLVVLMNYRASVSLVPRIQF